MTGRISGTSSGTSSSGDNNKSLPATKKRARDMTEEERPDISRNVREGPRGLASEDRGAPGEDLEVEVCWKEQARRKPGPLLTENGRASRTARTCAAACGSDQQGMDEASE